MTPLNAFKLTDVFSPFAVSDNAPMAAAAAAQNAYITGCRMGECRRARGPDADGGIEEIPMFIHLTRSSSFLYAIIVSNLHILT